jgi:mRNA-degrading endonuclease RelE of RelBE toxin-antitoxin system
MFEIVVTQTAKKSAKKLPSTIREEIVKQSQQLKENPYLGEKLSGSLHFLYSFHLTVKGTNYRFVYEVDVEKQQVVVHLMGPREGFYQRLKRLLG